MRATEEFNRSAKYLHGYFSSLEGFNVMFHSFNFSSSGLWGLNVVASKAGVDKIDEYVLLFAHYDSISDDPLITAPAADDNACGVAVMMEGASILSRCDLNRTLIFIAFSVEE